jgi:DNA-binding transcriptional LysR family regulator
VKGFLDCYPDIRLELTFNDRFVNLVEEGIDLAFRVGQVDDPTLIARRIGMTRRVTIASKSYFQDFSEPQTPEDLVHHNCIVYTRLTTKNEWHFQLPTGGTTQVLVKGNLQVDSSIAVREAVLAGLGIAVCPAWLFGELLQSDRLQIVLNDYQPVPLPIHAIYRRSRFVSAKVRCFIDYFGNEFKLNPWVTDYGVKSVSR